MNASAYIDQSLYPDEAAPNAESLTPEEKAEHVDRVCAAWEFDILPERETLETILGWKDVLERFPMPQHETYHTLRDLCGLPPIPGCIFELRSERLDAAEGRTDPCADRV